MYKRIAKTVFVYRGKYWYLNLKYIPTYFKQVHYFKKYGYEQSAIWNTFDWFIHTMRNILTEYNKTRCGFPLLGMNSEEEAEKAWDNIVKEMISLLDDMDEYNDKYENISVEEQYKMMKQAKDRFFELFSKYFYELWD